MILVITNSGDVTADLLCEGFRPDEFIRFDTDSATLELSVEFDLGKGATMCCDGLAVTPEQITGAWYRRPRKLHTPTPENLGDSEAECLRWEWLEAYEGFFSSVHYDKWVNHPSANSYSSHKLNQLTLSSSLTLRPPRSIVTNSSDRVHEFARLCPRLIVKPLGLGTVEQGGMSTTEFDVNELPKAQRLGCPTFFQEMIDKDFDVRMTVVDGDISCVAIENVGSDGQQVLDVRDGMIDNATYHTVDPPESVKLGVHQMMSAYRLRYGAFDFAVDKSGAWRFFELNPNGQWAWLDIDAGTGIAASLHRALRGGT